MTNRSPLMTVMTSAAAMLGAATVAHAQTNSSGSSQGNTRIQNQVQSMSNNYNGGIAKSYGNAETNINNNYNRTTGAEGSGGSGNTATVNGGNTVSGNFTTYIVSSISDRFRNTDAFLTRLTSIVVSDEIDHTDVKIAEEIAERRAQIAKIAAAGGNPAQSTYMNENISFATGGDGVNTTTTANTIDAMKFAEAQAPRKFGAMQAAVRYGNPQADFYGNTGVTSHMTYDRAGVVTFAVNDDTTALRGALMIDCYENKIGLMRYGQKNISNERAEAEARLLQAAANGVCGTDGSLVSDKAYDVVAKFLPYKPLKKERQFHPVNGLQ